MQASVPQSPRITSATSLISTQKALGHPSWDRRPNGKASASLTRIVLKARCQVREAQVPARLNSVLRIQRTQSAPLQVVLKSSVESSSLATAHLRTPTSPVTRHRPTRSQLRKRLIESSNLTLSKLKSPSSITMRLRKLKLVNLKDWPRASPIRLSNSQQPLELTPPSQILRLLLQKITVFLRKLPNKWPSLIEKLNLYTNSNLNCTRNWKHLRGKLRPATQKKNRLRNQLSQRSN